MGNQCSPRILAGVTSASSTAVGCAVPTSEASRPRQSTTRTALAGIIGNVLEWFDFAVYGFFVGAIGKQFFPNSDPAAQKLLAFVGFAAGFLARPFGSIALGIIGDRVGRRALLTVSIAMMGGSTLLLGLLPTYAQIGLAAPILLVVLRLLQGLSVGGEFTGSMVYTTELAAPRWRGLISSSTAAGTTIGNMLGNVSALIVSATLASNESITWQWRIPFLASAALCIGGWFLRRGIRETDEGEKAAALRAPIFESLVADWLPILRTFGIVGMTNAAYYLTFTFAAERRASSSAGNAGKIFWASNLVSLAVVLIAKPIGGWLSDRMGRRRLMMILTIVGMASIYIALPTLLTGSPWEFWGAQIMIAVPTGMALGLHGAMLVEIFPLRTRVTSMSFAYGITLVLAGAATPALSTWLLDILHQPSAPGYGIMLYGAIGLALMWPMKETNARRLDTNDLESVLPAQPATR
jgi:MHS family proline/betaine transporter-like MFS transporter